MSETCENLVFFNQNIRSLRQNFDLFLSELSNLKISLDFIILTEVWISTDEINLYSIHGYNVFSCCNNYYRAGGVVIYAKLRYQCNVMGQSDTDRPIGYDLPTVFNSGARTMMWSSLSWQSIDCIVLR
jgi:hypothetical protein